MNRDKIKESLEKRIEQSDFKKSTFESCRQFILEYPTLESKDKSKRLDFLLCDVATLTNESDRLILIKELAEKGIISNEEALRRVCPIADTSTETVSIPLTDLGNAERFVAKHKDDVRYCHAWKKWLVWDGRRWEVDATAQVWRYAIDTVRHIYLEAAQIGDPNKRKEVGNYALKSESEAKISAMLALAHVQEGTPVKSEELDKDALLLNVLNGTIDLKTGELRPHNKDDLITKLAPINYDIYELKPLRELCPKWCDFLEKITCGNEDLIGFLRRMVGYCLTGKTSEQKLLFLYGNGANGKTTFLKVLQGIFGDYAIKAASEILLAMPVGSHTTSVTDLKGARLAITVEVQEGRRLAEALVKELTGGDSITARRMRQDNMTFEPTHKIVLAANHKPIVHETTHALWRRIDLIPFNYVFPESERIKDYHEILLKEEKDGIFLWALKGCLEWQEVGLKESVEVVEATRDYKDEMDILNDFISDCCVVGQREQVTNKDLRNSYKAWCEENGEKELSPKALANRLQEKGFIKGKDTKNRFWRGIGLKSSDTL